MPLIRYLGQLNTGRLILWCYFCWYLVVLIRYFDPQPRLWLTSVGISLIIGIALYISTTNGRNQKVTLERWPVIRLFLMPFFVSSFSALVKGKGFWLIFSPDYRDTLAAVALCTLVMGARWASRKALEKWERTAKPATTF